MNWIGWTRRGTEIDTRDELRAMGVQAHVPQEISMERRGKDRRPRPYTEPVLPGILFIRGSADDFLRIQSVRTLASTMLAFPDQSWNAYVAPFLAECAQAHDAMQARVNAGEALEQYNRGQKLQIKSGPFAEQVAEFVRVVERAHDLHPLIQAEMEVFGSYRTVELDPLDVKSA